MLLWRSQRGVITQDRSLAPDFYQKELVTGRVFGLSHVYYCLYVKRPQRASDTSWRSNVEKQWETDHSLGGGEQKTIYSWCDLISFTCIWLQIYLIPSCKQTEEGSRLSGQFGKASFWDPEELNDPIDFQVGGSASEGDILMPKCPIQARLPAA